MELATGATIALGFGVIRGLSEEEFLEAMERVAKGGLKMQAIGSLERWFPYYEGFFCAKSLDESLTSRSEERRGGKEGRSRWWAYH